MRIFREGLSVCKCVSFPFGFEGEMCDLIVTRSLLLFFPEYMHIVLFFIQSTLVISKSKGPSETLRDIRMSTYQICRIEENTHRTTKFHK